MLILLLILFLTGSHARGAVPVPLLTGAQVSWKFIGRTDGIEMYERWIRVRADLEVRERKGVMTVEAPVGVAVSLICDPAMAPDWMAGVSESYVLRRLSEEEWYTYTLYSIPWPFDNRDLVTRYTVVRMPEEATVRIELLSEEGVLEEQQGIQRLRHYQASWEVEPLGGNQTRITFVARSDDPPPYPRWLQDPIVADAFLDNLENLKKILEIQNH